MAGLNGAGWACAQCTLINAERRRSCEACGRRRAKSPVGCSPTSGASPDAPASGASQPSRLGRRGAAAGSASPAVPASSAPASDGADGSLGYASRLTFRADLGGQLGAPELSETERSRADKVRELASLIASASHLVVFTGAGISTSIGIPDFRGPDGVWTCQRRGTAMPKASMPFSQARPSYTHMALLALQRCGRLKYLCSQNVDCLHLRSGFPRDQMAELHGNCFAERCTRCGIEVLRDFEVPSVGFKPTGRSCPSCHGAMRDHTLDWDDELPEAELSATERHAAKADLCLCLGTSLQITPACNLPMRALRKQAHKPEGGKVAIINLQATPKDRRASVVIHDKVDGVMRALMRELRLEVPCYERTDALDLVLEMPISAVQISAAEIPSSAAEMPISAARAGVGDALAGSAAGAFVVRLRSVHGEGCPIPWLRECTVCFEHAAPGTSPAILAPPAWRAHLSQLRLPPSGIASARLSLTFEAGATESGAEVVCHVSMGPAGSGVDPQPAGGAVTDTGRCHAEPTGGAVAGLQQGSHRVEVVTCRVEYEEAPNTEVGAEVAPAALTARKRGRNT